MKKGYISIYILIVVLLLSLVISFLYQQSQNTADFNEDLYDKKQAIYLSESIMNEFVVNGYENLIVDKQISNYKKGLKVDNNISVSFNSSITGENYKFSFIKIKKFDKNLPKDISVDGLFMINMPDINVGDSRASGSLYLEQIYNPVIFARKILKYEDIKDSVDLISFKTEKVIADDLADSKSELVETISSLRIDDNAPSSFDGILIVNGDMILDKPFSLNGYLIVKGNLICNDESSLNVNGGLVINDYNQSKVKFIRNPSKYMDYILIDDGIIKTNIKVKNVY